MTGVQVKKIVTQIHETGVGQEPREEVSYALVGDCDGVEVTFASVSEGRVSDAKIRAERIAEREKAEKAASAPAKAQ